HNTQAYTYIHTPVLDSEEDTAGCWQLVDLPDGRRGVYCVSVCVRARASVSVTVGVNKHNLMQTHEHSTITQACTNTHTPIHGRCG
ncbi:MAG: hypothetical protein ACPIOQ_22925, partial [Promethearchaeia archaeon]